jgi:hypothetical protein
MEVRRLCARSSDPDPYSDCCICCSIPVRAITPSRSAEFSWSSSSRTGVQLPLPTRRSSNRIRFYTLSTEASSEIRLREAGLKKNSDLAVAYSANTIRDGGERATSAEGGGE